MSTDAQAAGAVLLIALAGAGVGYAVRDGFDHRAPVVSPAPSVITVRVVLDSAIEARIVHPEYFEPAE